MSEYVIEIPDYVPPFDPFARAASLGEEIVRCRDCIHCEEAINGKALCERFSMEGSLGTLYPTVEWDGFCKWGERMDE